MYDRPIQLTLDLMTALNTIEDAGYQAWLVGGCVRDAILKRQWDDWDITTDAHWKDVERIFLKRGFNVHRTGCDHGTVTVVVNGEPFEVTTFRTESGYSDNRHPDNVEFVSSLDEDLARRDFTMNAIAFHPVRGFYDPFNGVDDIFKKTIRCVGDPDKRFSEDALRILRGCRFASQLGFNIEKNTYQAMLENKGLLLKISHERVSKELTKLLLGENVFDALIDYADILVTVLPELAAMRGLDQHNPYHIYDVYEHTAHVVANIPATSTLRWAALFHDVGKPSTFFVKEDGVGHFYGHPLAGSVIAESALTRLRMPRALIDDVTLLVRYHDEPIAATHKSVKRKLKVLNDDTELFKSLCLLKIADGLGHAENCRTAKINNAKELLSILDEIIENDEAFTVRDLAINGTDLINLGVKQGPEIGRLLNAALDAVINESVPNDHAELIAFISMQSNV